MPEIAEQIAAFANDYHHYLAIAGILVAAVAVIGLVWDDY